MDHLGNTLVGLAFQALVVYGVLRLVHGSPRPEADPMRQARRHAFWAAVIALVAGGVLGQTPFTALLDAGSRSGDHGLLEDLVATGLPLLSVCGVYVLAQFTGPIGGGALRTADLTVRDLRGYLPVGLTIVTAVMALLSGIAIALTATLPAVAPGGPSMTDGRVPLERPPGTYFALAAGGVHLLFVLGVLLALTVIVRRRRVPTLTHVEDSIIRRVFINRLLRTAALVSVSGLSGALEFASNGSFEEPWNNLRTVLVVVWFSTVLAMLAFRPPVRAEIVDEPVHAEPPVVSGSARHAGLVVLSGRRLGYGMFALCLVPFLLVLQDPGSPAGLVTLAAGYIGFGGTQLLAEVALTRNHGAGPGRGRAGVRSLPAAVKVLAGVAVVLVLGLAATTTAIGARPGSAPALPLWTASSVLVVAVLGVVAMIAATRPPLRRASRAEDDALRTGTVRRLLLMICSAVLALTAILLWQNRAAVVDDAPGTFPGGSGAPLDVGQFDTLVVLLLIAATVLAFLPQPREVLAPAPSTAPDTVR